MDEMIHRGKGLVDLVAGKQPIFSGWTNNPTDAVDITDGDPTTICTTGDKVCGGGYQECYIEYDLGGSYDVIVNGLGYTHVLAGGGRLYIQGYDGANWMSSYSAANNTQSLLTWASVGFQHVSKIRTRHYSDGATTISPQIGFISVWRL